MRLETRLPTAVDVDCFDDFIWDVVDGTKELVSSYMSSTVLPSFISDFTSTLIGSNVLIDCEVDTEESWKLMELVSSWLKELSLYIFLFGEIAEQDEGDPDIKEVDELLLSKGVSGAIS